MRSGESARARAPRRDGSPAADRRGPAAAPVPARRRHGPPRRPAPAPRRDRRGATRAIACSTAVEQPGEIAALGGAVVEAPPPAHRPAERRPWCAPATARSRDGGRRRRRTRAHPPLALARRRAPRWLRSRGSETGVRPRAISAGVARRTLKPTQPARSTPSDAGVVGERRVARRRGPARASGRGRGRRRCSGTAHADGRPRGAPRRRRAPRCGRHPAARRDARGAAVTTGGTRHRRDWRWQDFGRDVIVPGQTWSGHRASHAPGRSARALSVRTGTWNVARSDNSTLSGCVRCRR